MGKTHFNAQDNIGDQSHELDCLVYSPIHLADSCKMYERVRRRIDNVSLSNVHLLSFADNAHSPSLKRLNRQAKFFDFTSVHLLTEDDLDDKFRHSLAEFLVPGVKGYGFWLWKPQVISQTLERIPDGDVLLYLDAGCHLQRSGIKRFQEYRFYVDTSESGILGFQFRPPNPEVFPIGEIPADITDAQYAKVEVLSELGIPLTSTILATPGLQAGTIFIRNSASQRRFIRDWLHLATNSPHLFSDVLELSIQQPGFIEPRHDQTIFSLLSKRSGVDTVSAWETWLPGMSSRKREKFSASPIVARRDLTRRRYFPLRRRAQNLKSGLTT